MSGKQTRSYLVGFTAVAVILLIVSVFSASYYYSSSSSLTAKDQEILHLKAMALAQNATQLELEVDIVELNSNITTLDQKVSGLTQSQEVSSSEITSLVDQVMRLQNQSALLSLELSVVEGAAGPLAIQTYFVNDSVTVASNTTLLLTSQNPGEAGTLVFDSPTGCASPGSRVLSSSPTFVYYILLNSAATGVVQSIYENVNATSFSFSLQNAGLSAVSCTFSLFYVDQ